MVSQSYLLYLELTRKIQIHHDGNVKIGDHKKLVTMLVNSDKRVSLRLHTSNPDQESSDLLLKRC
jgi:hypothetical protein